MADTIREEIFEVNSSESSTFAHMYMSDFIDWIDNKVYLLLTDAHCYVGDSIIFPPLPIQRAEEEIEAYTEDDAYDEDKCLYKPEEVRDYLLWVDCKDEERKRDKEVLSEMLQEVTNGNIKQDDPTLLDLLAKFFFFTPQSYSKYIKEHGVPEGYNYDYEVKIDRGY